MRIRPPSIKKISRKSGMSTKKVRSFLDLLRRSMKPVAKRIGVTENAIKRYYTIERRGIGIIHTAYGEFWQYSFAIDDRWEKYSVIVKAGLDRNLLIPIFNNAANLIIRTDSGCETGQVFGDLTCECGKQLQLALKTLKDVGEGMIINIPLQDGRGMGLTFKLATLWMQKVLKVDTVESAALLASDGLIDIRTYSGIICILKFFGISEKCQINLATNNPQKAKVFFENGYNVADYTPLIIKPNRYTKKHLRAKQRYLGHRGLIDRGAKK